ncbi:tetratricopeptide repeat protein [Achromobacter sp. NPDC058515]|uniref:type III secretion apparatus assembly chaperone SctY n=1 Tax=Achromobacter sp. NPDC058515 TaxID=3346533 RepID=UPI003664CEFE
MPLTHEARELLSLLAYIYLENNRPEKTAVLLNALRAMGLADTRQLATLALAQLRAGKPEAALSTLDGLALQGGVDAPFHLIRAQTLQALERRDEAAAAMRAYVALRPAATALPTKIEST